MSYAQAAPAAKPAPDTVSFDNGDQITGKLLRIVSGKLIFHSDILGDVTIPIAKVKTLSSAQTFAVIEKSVIDKGRHESRKAFVAQIPLGPIAIDGNTITIASSADNKHASYPLKEMEYIVDAGTLHRELQGESNLFYGWKGAITLGASLVDGTNKDETYNGAVNFVRTIPAIPWLPPFSRYTLNLNGSYGLLSQPQIVSGGTVIQTESSAKTDILHGDTEYDKYISPRFYSLANASADHNFGSGLQLQQTYGVGFGWTLLKMPKQEFDLKADLHYEQQQFYNGTTSGLGTPSENLIGADLTESWNRKFAHDIQINEFVTATPAFNVFRAYSGVASASLVFPVYKKISFSLLSTDNYLADPPVGYQRNTFQFTAGVTYVLK